MNLILISISIPLLLVFFVLLLKRNSETKRFFLSQNADIDDTIKGLIGIFGADLLALLPEEYAQRQLKESKLVDLFKRSGNPFNITIPEFLILKIIMGALGILVGVGLFFFFQFIGIGFISYIMLVVFPFVMYNYPTSKYKSVAKSRESQFLKQLPDLVDYLIMLIQGNMGLTSAFEECVQYLPEGIIKDETIIIVSDLRLGKSMKQALESFADRAPSTNIHSFVQSVINANELSVSMIDILRNQSRMIRKDLMLEIEKRIVKLPSKMTMTLSPTAAIAIGLIAIAPAITVITQMM